MGAKKGERESEAIRRERQEGATAIRRELSRLFVNANLLRIIWTSKGVQLAGRVEKQYERMRVEGFDALSDGNAFDPVNARFLRTLENAIRDASGVRHIDWKIDGWLAAGGEFIPLG